MVHSNAIPDLDGAIEFSDKCNKLRTTLFPTSDGAISIIPENFVASQRDLSDTFTPVSKSEVKQGFRAINQNSAVGCDKITYATLIHLNSTNPDIIPHIATALLRFGYHYHKWKHAICVVIPNQGKSSYKTAKSYRPISLLSCLGKIIEKIAATRISNAGKICGAISRCQFGNKDSHSASDVLLRTLTHLSPHLLSCIQMKCSYNNLKRPSLAAHDILGAFNNTKPDILVQIMVQRGMPTYLINWTRNFTADRTLSFSFDNHLEPPKPFKNAIPQGSPVSPILFSIMMSAVMDADDKANLQTCTAYVDDLSEIYADKNIGPVMPVLSNSFNLKARRAAEIGLSFASDKSEVIHFSLAARRKSKYPEHLTLTDTTPARDIFPSNQIKLLGVIVDDTLNFIVHAQHASSKGMQALGSLRYLRKGLNGIPPYIARYLAISKILPKMLWASPIWWKGSQSILYPLEMAYHKIARWITGLPPSTRITKLLRCAHLPPLNIWLDLISTKYAIRLITLPNDHGLYPIPIFQPTQASLAGPHRLLSFVSQYLGDRIERRSDYNPINIDPIQIHFQKPKDEDEKHETRRIHRAWTDSLPIDSIIIYSDGSRSQTSQIGAGWVIYRKGLNEYITVSEGSCYLGERMEVFDAELHAAYEGLNSVQTMLDKPEHIFLCIDNSSAIEVLSNNPDRIEGAFKTTEVAKLLSNQGWKINTVWVPSHCDIEGNESADKLAKLGTDHTLTCCPLSYTSYAWMNRIAQSTFVTRWRQEIGMPDITWKYPAEWKQWSYWMARTVFRVYCGRTEIDPRHEHEAEKCECGEADLCTDHVIGHCRLFDQLRYEAQKGCITPPTYTKELVLDKIWSEQIQEFLRKTRLGFTKELNYKPIPRNNEENTDTPMSEEFDVGTFE
jgi:ribonuclease HI